MTNSRSYDFLWLSIALLPLVALSFMLAVPAQDYWWYLRLGKDILQQGVVPLTDTLGYSRFGLPIFYQQWLSGIVFYLVYQSGGAALTFLLRAVLIGVTYAFIWRLTRSFVGARAATILLILLGLSTSNNWMIRPQLFAYPLFILCFYAANEWQKGNNKALLLFPLSVLFWVNLHGSFVLPFLVVGAALIFGSGERKPLLYAVGAMLVVSLLNPRGFDAWRYLVFILNNPSDYLFSVEWRPPLNAGWQMNIFFAWLLIFPALAAFSTRRLSRFEWILFLGFGWLALSGMRYVIWFMFLLAIFSAKLVGEWTNAYIDRPLEKINPRLNNIIAAMLLLLPLIFMPRARDSWWKDAPDLYELTTTPIAATDFLKAHEELPAPLWNDYAFGSYLEFALPSRPTWMDARMYSFPQTMWEEYVRVSSGDDWQAMFDREGINLLLLSQAAQPNLIRAVADSPAWRLEYRDEYAVVFSRRSAK